MNPRLQYEIVPNNASPTLPPSPNQPAVPSPPEISKQRLKILPLILISTAAYSFAESLLYRMEVESSLRVGQQSHPANYAYIFPILCGIIIYRFGAKRAYQFIAGASALAVALAASGFEKKSFEPFEYGEFFFYGSRFGLYAIHIFMIAKYFREKGLSLAMGAFSIFPIVPEILLNVLYPTRELGDFNGWPISEMFEISCVLGVIAVLILTKLDKEAQPEGGIPEENQLCLMRDLRSITAITYILMGGIIIFTFMYYLGLCYTQARVILDESNRFDENDEVLKRMFHLDFSSAVVVWIIFGLLADKKGKRISIMLLSFMVKMMGLIFLILASSSKNLRDVFLASVLDRIATYSFHVSSWACLSLSVPQRVLGIFLGLAYAGTCLRARWSMGLVSWPPVGLLLTCGTAGVLGIILMIAGLVVNKRNGGNLNSCSMKNEREVVDLTDLELERESNSENLE